MPNDKENIRTIAGKREFLKNFLNSVRDELIAKADKMPAEWDGFELRWLVADKFEWEQRNRTADAGGGWRRRARNFKNECIVRNL